MVPSVVKKKKKVIPGLVDIDKDICAVVVHYEVVEEDDDYEGLKRTKHVKRYRLKKLKASAEKLAEDVMRQSTLIPASKRKVLEMLIANLQEHYENDPEALERVEEMRKGRSVVETEGPDMEKIDDYIEMLYEEEDMEEENKNEAIDQRMLRLLNERTQQNKKKNEKKVSPKVRATGLILALAVDVSHLEVLAQHQTLMGALARVFSEEYRKNFEVTFNIARFFLALANFAQMHPLLAQQRVGKICVEILSYEVKRAEHRVTSQKSDDSKNERRELLLRKKQEKVLFVCLQILFRVAEDASVEQKMVKLSVAELAASVLEHAVSVPLLQLTADFLKKLVRIESTKDRLCETSLAEVLTNRFFPLAEGDLTTSLLSLVFNLSFDRKFRLQLQKQGFVASLVTAIKASTKCREKGLRILYHLSAEDEAKIDFARCPEALPVILQLILRFPANRKLPKELAGLAVNLSLAKENAILFCANKSLQSIFERVQRTNDTLLMKVIRNVALWTFNQQQTTTISEDPSNDDLKRPSPQQQKISFFETATKRSRTRSFDDDSSGESAYPQRGHWSRLVLPILNFAMTTESQDMLLECLGTLGNLTDRDLPRGVTWAKIVDEKNLAGFLSKLLVPGMAQHDVVLEAIIVSGALARDDPEAACLLASSSLARSLEEVWHDRADDPEILLQLLYTFQMLLRSKETHDELLYNSRVLLDMLDCLDHDNEVIVKYADACLDLVLERDRENQNGLAFGELGAQVRNKRFQRQNPNWLDIVQNASRTLHFNKQKHAPFDPSSGLSSSGEDSDSLMSPSSDDDDRMSSPNDWERKDFPSSSRGW